MKGKRFFCSKCGHGFTTRQNLEVHLNSDTPLCRPCRNNDDASILTCQKSCVDETGAKQAFKRRESGDIYELYMCRLLGRA